jgi:hypothetical protein
MGKKYIDQMFRPSSKVDVQLLEDVIKGHFFQCYTKGPCITVFVQDNLIRVSKRIGI